ncbi:MAG TPA: NADH-quinone oxidoreductase subunit J [Burkholderiaceae bacterium]|nr:NADH-quinone oxidoreductase subunit J [Burkholderiaceae bacterium]HYB51396.1 NADH-quinone oxidoreductase subunit J [Burkholderiaceae bacterium]
MDPVAALFAVFSASTLVSAVRVITARNPVHAVLYLVLCFFSAACLWLLLQAEFLAIALVLVYVGAVMVLFLFVVMMLDIQIDRLRVGFWRHLPLAALIGVAIALQLWLVLANGHWQFLTPPVTDVAKVGNTKALGQLTFTEYLLPLQMAGAILLVAIVAAIALTLRRRSDSLHQRPGDQVRVRARDRLTIVHMPPAVHPTATAKAPVKEA